MDRELYDILNKSIIIQYWDDGIIHDMFFRGSTELVEKIFNSLTRYYIVLNTNNSEFILIGQNHEQYKINVLSKDDSNFFPHLFLPREVIIKFGHSLFDIFIPIMGWEDSFYLFRSFVKERCIRSTSFLIQRKNQSVLEKIEIRKDRKHLIFYPFFVERKDLPKFKDKEFLFEDFLKAFIYEKIFLENTELYKFLTEGRWERDTVFEIHVNIPVGSKNIKTTVIKRRGRDVFAQS